MTGCVFAPIPPCPDYSACTTDSCNPATGCVFTPNPPCIDGNACTTDICSPATGCVFANNNDPCSDGNPCTTGDVCAGGTCVAGPPTNCDDGDLCTQDSCAGGGCAHENTLCGACCLPAGPCADDVTLEECSSIPAYGGLFQGVGSVCLGDADGDGLDDLCDTGDTIPTVSEWGLVILTLLLLTCAKIYFGKRPVAAKVITDC